MMRNRNISEHDQKRSRSLRLGAYGFIAAFIGMMLWAANAQLNGGTEGIIYYLSWVLIILGIATAFPNVYGIITQVDELRSRRKS